MRSTFLIYLAFFLNSSAVAIETSKVEISGSFRIREEVNDRTDFASDRDFFSFRFRPRFTLLGDHYTLLFAPQFARVMGEPSTGRGTSGSTIDPFLGVHETFLSYRLKDHFILTGGRMILSYGDELVIGALEWNNVGRSFDGFKVRYEHEHGAIDAFITKIFENNITTPSSPDSDFAGIYSSNRINDWIEELDLYALYASSYLGAGGIRARSNIGSFDYRAEFTREFGRGSFSENAFQADAEAGYSFNTLLSPRFGFGIFHAGADYFQLYPTAHKWLGQADVLARRNVSGFVLNGSIKPTSDLKILASYHHFNRVSVKSPAYMINGISPLGQASRSGSQDIGSEADLNFSYSLESKTTLSAGGSLFFPGSYLRDQYESKP